MENKLALKCEYPLCSKEGVERHTLSLINEKNSSVELPFCKYHFYIVLGGHFKAEIHRTKDGSEFDIIGPLENVEIVEQVMGAIEMTKKLQSENKDLNKK